MKSRPAGDVPADAGGNARLRTAPAALLLASILLRLWFALGYWADKPLTQDANEYLELARNFNRTGAFQYDEHHTFQIESYGRAPGYPFWLALLLRVSPSLSWIRTVEALINVLATFVLFLIGKQLFGVRTGILAWVVATCYIPFFSLIPPILSENLWILLMLFAYLFLVRAQLIPAACILATATLVRPGAVFLLPFFGYWLYRHKGWKSAASVILLYALILLPWNLHVSRQEGRFVFVASEGGVTFWTGTHPRYSGDGDLSVNPDVQKEYREILKSHAGEPPAQKERLFYTEGLANVLDHPAASLWNEARQQVYAFLPFGPSVLHTSLLHRVTGILFYLAVLALALPSLRNAPPDARLLLAGIAVSYAVMVLLFFPQERFRIAMIDPLLIVFAAYEIGGWLKRT